MGPIMGDDTERLCPGGVAILKILSLSHVHAMSNVHGPEVPAIFSSSLASDGQVRSVSVSVDQVLAMLDHSE